MMGMAYEGITEVLRAWDYDLLELYHNALADEFAVLSCKRIVGVYVGDIVHYQIHAVDNMGNIIEGEFETDLVAAKALFMKYVESSRV